MEWVCIRFRNGGTLPVYQEYNYRLRYRQYFGFGEVGKEEGGSPYPHPPLGRTQISHNV